MGKCLKCGKEHDGSFGSGKYCNRGCANSRVRTEESKRTTSLTMQGYHFGNANKGEREIIICCLCGEEFEVRISEKNKKVCSRCAKKEGKWTDEMKTFFSQYRINFYKDNPEKHPNRSCAGIKESYPEKMLREYFEQNGLIKEKDFFQQYKVDKFYVDFYIPKLNLGIEVDGERWHTDLVRELHREEVILKTIKLIRFKAKPLIKKLHQNDIDNIINAVVAPN